MKKLFTLVALLACFMGANAAKYTTIVDAEVDYSTMPDGDASTIRFYGWGASQQAKDRLSIKNGCLHFESSEVTLNDQGEETGWLCQFHPIGGVDAEAGVVYTLHFKIKGDHNENVSMLGFGQTPYGQFPITDQWVEGTVDYECVPDGNGNISGDILMQCGSYVGTWDIAYLKITHEEKEAKPVTWQNIVKNGDASTPWANPAMDAHDGQNGTVCAWSKEWGTLMNGTNADAGGAAIPEVHTANIENGVFVSHAKKVEPALLWASEGDLWGQHHNVGDEMPDNTWQNQFWIMFPKALADGEQYKLKFDYKASKAVSVPTQDHTAPGDYLGGGKVGNLSFTTEWQTYEKVLTAAAGVQSLAFNLTGDGTNWKEDVDFYFDNIEVSLMVLDEGLFVAPANPAAGIDYDLDEAISCDYDPSAEAYVLTVGEKGKPETWISEVMISTVRGNDRAFKAASLKPDASVEIDGTDPEQWISYEVSNGAKIKLPAAGVWQISIATDTSEMNFLMLEGESLGIENVSANNNKANTVSYNLAGQRVTKNFKGIVVKNGKKYFAK